MKKDKTVVTAMDCWHYIAPLIPVADQMSTDIYVNTFHAFQLLEEEEKQKHDQRADT